MSKSIQVVPVILAGGSGTRLWPMSRENYPKHFLNLFGERSLLQETVARTLEALTPSDIILVTNDNHYFLCQDQLAEVTSAKIHYILEPVAKNTAPAIAIAAQYIQQHIGAEAVMLVLPSDHLIADVSGFAEAVAEGLSAAISGQLAIFGVTPTAPKTGYGYIEQGELLQSNIFNVKRFVEKPDLITAQAYVAQGNYFWNSGMFLFMPSVYLAELKNSAADIFAAASLAYQHAELHKDFLRLSVGAYGKIRSESIDYAVMEHTQQVVMIPLDLHWNDLGCWSSVAESGVADENDNVIRGNILAQNSSNCFLSSDNRLIAALGLQNHIVVSTEDAVLVADKKYSQEVKQLVAQLKQDHGSNGLARDHKKVSRPWGYYESLAIGPGYQVKHIMVKPGAKLSLQSHQHRAEHWAVVAGVAEVVNGGNTLYLRTNESTYIERQVRHRLSNPGKQALHVIEVQTGEYLGEDDIVRYEDVYGR